MLLLKVVFLQVFLLQNSVLLRYFIKIDLSDALISSRRNSEFQ